MVTFLVIRILHLEVPVCWDSNSALTSTDPFIAQTTAEFWRRWHMSLFILGLGITLYLPLSSGMRRWGQWGVFLSLSLTFAGLGAWHGAGWNYIIYGLIQGLLFSMK